MARRVLQTRLRQALSARQEQITPGIGEGCRNATGRIAARTGPATRGEKPGSHNLHPLEVVDHAWHDRQTRAKRRISPLPTGEAFPMDRVRPR
jgi:hypothetical protein